MMSEISADVSSTCREFGKDIRAGGVGGVMNVIGRRREKRLERTIKVDCHLVRYRARSRLRELFGDQAITRLANAQESSVKSRAAPCSLRTADRGTGLRTSPPRRRPYAGPTIAMAALVLVQDHFRFHDRRRGRSRIFARARRAFCHAGPVRFAAAFGPSALSAPSGLRVHP